MLNLAAAAAVLRRLPIRDRDSGNIINFVINPNQLTMFRMLQQRVDSGHPLPYWYICCKARRVGVSSATEALLTLNDAALPNRTSKIVSHLADTSDALFSVPLNLVRGLPYALPRPTKKEIVFPHRDGQSTLSIATAGTVAGGRGTTLSDLHASEAAFFPSGESLLSLINAVIRTRNGIVGVESTANGKTGQGETFFNLWQDAVAGKNEFLPIFLSWLDDPACRRPSEEVMQDVPADEDERDIIAMVACPDYCGRCDRCHKAFECVAWRRWAIPNLCQGYVELFHQEYPVTAEEAFITSGDPIFTREELRSARSTVKPPIVEGALVVDDGNTPPTPPSPSVLDIEPEEAQNAP